MSNICNDINEYFGTFDTSFTVFLVGILYSEWGTKLKPAWGKHPVIHKN